MLLRSSGDAGIHLDARLACLICGMDCLNEDNFLTLFDRQGSSGSASIDYGIDVDIGANMVQFASNRQHTIFMRRVEF